MWTRTHLLKLIYAILIFLKPFCGGRPLVDGEGAVGRSLDKSTEPWIELLSYRPRAYLYHNFLSKSEADHIVSLAKPFMKRSTVVGNGGQGVFDNIRTSYGTFINRLQDEVVEAIEERVALWTHLNVTHQEDLQVLRYAHGQKYGAHSDVLVEGSPRVATVLLYLNDVKAGGETAFPSLSRWIDDSVPKRLGPFSKCADGHVAAKPRKGDALLFFSVNNDGTFDDAATHTGCPVTEGTKWTGTIWIHARPFRPESFGQVSPFNKTMLPENCIDFEPSCQKWANEGECQNNPTYMLGTSYALGVCRHACGLCEKCKPGDRDCQSKNRARAGYLSFEELDSEE